VTRVGRFTTQFPVGVGTSQTIDGTQNHHPSQQARVWQPIHSVGFQQDVLSDIFRIVRIVKHSKGGSKQHLPMFFNDVSPSHKSSSIA